MGNKRKREKTRHNKFNAAGGMHSFKRKRNPHIKVKSAVNSGQNSGSFSLKRRHGLKFNFVRHSIKKAHKYLCIKHSDGINVTLKRKENQLLGNRVINLDKLRIFVGEISSHTAICESAQNLVMNDNDAIKIVTEERHGLYVVLKCLCIGCNKMFQIDNGSDIPSPRGTFKDINVRSVWGSMASGGGHSSMTEFLGTLGIPTVNSNEYIKIEEQIGDWWKSVLYDEMKQAGEEERNYAIENGSYFQGVPAISVVCDGGWSKRSHKHTYNAMGGVGVIFGLHTKKLLHIGIRNRLCYICSRAENTNSLPVAHDCFKNWNQSSQSMESDIILEGFQQCEKVHGVRYMKLIADGDSSVYASIVKNIPVWGHHVQKLECANHACKCLRVNLERLVDDKPQYKGSGKLSKRNIQRIVVGVRCAIKMRSSESDIKKATKKLKDDICNAGKHVLGIHDNCSTDFCKNKEPTLISHEINEELGDDDDDCIEEQFEFWSGTVKDLDAIEIESLRKGGEKSRKDVDESMLKDLFHVLNRVSDKADRLVGNFTSNLAESWMHIRCKFDGGKMSNRCFRGSFYARCYGGSLRAMQGPAWSPITYSQVTGQRPDDIFVQTYRKRALKYICTKKQHSSQKFKKYRSKRKLTSHQASKSKKAKQDYGPGVLIDTSDISKDDLQNEMDKYYNCEVKKSVDEIQKIESLTRDQSANEKWRDERKKRLTSSSFGEVMSRSVHNNSTALTKRLLYSNFCGNKYTRKGLTEEENTRKEYMNVKNKDSEIVSNIKVPGLVIDSVNPHLATSSDGIVEMSDGSSGLIEIKNLLQTTDMNIKQAASRKKSFCLSYKNNKLELKPKHKFFYQIQGQMNILNKEWCDLVIRRTNPYDIFIQRIYKDEGQWKEIMLPKLNAFYFSHILPELAVPRHLTTTGIRKTAKLPWFETSTSRKSPCVPCHKKLSPLQHQDDIQPSTSRSVCARRQLRTKFVGRQILHKWEEEDGVDNWYSGRVTGVKSGKDGQRNAIYLVYYDKDDETYEIENLQEDFDEGSIRFTDI